MATTEKQLRVEDIEVLMAAMAKSGVSSLEWGGLRLSRVSDRGRELSPASAIAAPAGTSNGPAVSVSEAYATVQRARLQSQANAEARIAAAQARTEGAREKALSRAAANTPIAKAVKDVYDISMSSAPHPSAGP